MEQARSSNTHVHASHARLPHARLPPRHVTRSNVTDDRLSLCHECVMFRAVASRAWRRPASSRGGPPGVRGGTRGTRGHRRRCPPPDPRGPAQPQRGPTRVAVRSSPCPAAVTAPAGLLRAGRAGAAGRPLCGKPRPRSRDYVRAPGPSAARDGPGIRAAYRAAGTGARHVPQRRHVPPGCGIIRPGHPAPPPRPPALHPVPSHGPPAPRPRGRRAAGPLPPAPRAPQGAPSAPAPPAGTSPRSVRQRRGALAPLYWRCGWRGGGHLEGSKRRGGVAAASPASLPARLHCSLPPSPSPSHSSPHPHPHLSFPPSRASAPSRLTARPSPPIPHSNPHTHLTHPTIAPYTRSIRVSWNTMIPPPR